ncbi:hypothetical protein NBM05_07255 [Rothia sp. AR01]|uniref:Uncharacterized protein n=1 Tax=Rothia santali TaxID=2949643 RepID=A0A9X2HJ37_9MICC|nr:hypothetical protein [Rothia santali]MCP3425808.1 hypothetical protein [Rothia santali]
MSLLPGMEEAGLYPGLVPGEAVDAVDAVDAVLGALEEREGAPSPAEYEEWDRLAARVVESQDRVEALLAARQRCHEVVPMLMRAQNTISRTARQLGGVRGTEQALEEELRAAEAEHRAAWDRTSELSDVIAAHLGAAPGVVRRTVTLGRAGPPWRARLEELRDRRAETQRTEEASRARRDALQRELSRARADAEALREELQESAATVRSLQDELAAYPHRRHAVDQEWLAGDWQEDTASAPWLDAEVQAARVEAYRSAARLHGLVLRLQTAEVRAGLLLARELLGAGAEQAPDAAAAGEDAAPDAAAAGRDAASRPHRPAGT